MNKTIQMILAVFIICFFIFPAAADQISNEKVEFTYHITSGWNMVSLPVLPDNPTVSGIFGDKVSIIFGWTGTQYEYIPLDEVLEPKQAYWILAHNDFNQNITGTPIANISIALNGGWNMVGLVSSGVTVGSLTDVACVIEWTGTEYLELDDEHVLEMTKGYWMLSNEVVILKNPEVSINAPESVSGTFSATIDITNINNLDSGQFDLSFNTNVINVTSVDSGSIGGTEIPVESWSFIDSDTIKVLFNIPGVTGVSGSGSIATIQFAVTGTQGDISTLEITDGLLVNTESGQILATWINDEVTVGETTSEAQVSVNAPETVSGTFDAVIDIANVINLDCGVFDLTFDPNVIKAVDVEPGRISGTEVPVDMWRLMDDGRIRVIINLPGATGVSGSGNIARISFEVNGSIGDTSLLTINGNLVNSNAQEISAIWNNDEISVVAPVAVTVNAPESVSGTFNATIDITNITDLDSGQFDLSFGANVVNVTGVDSGCIGTTEIPVDTWSFVDSDTIRVLLNLPDTTGVSGSGTLATIHFTVTGSNGNTSALDISDGLLVDVNAIPVYALWNDDEIIVGGEVTPEVPVEVKVNAPETVAGTFEVTIDIENVTGMLGGQFDLSFNPDVVNVTAINDGSIGATTNPLRNWTFMDVDTVRVLTLLQEDPNGMTGSGYIAKITFEVIGSPGDTSILDISDGILADNNADEIPANWTDDEITVGGEVTPEVSISVNAPETVSDTFDAVIEITDVTDLDAGQFDLSFNANIVNVTGVESGTIGTTEIRLDQWSFVDPDTIRVLINLPGATGVSGTGSLVTIHFDVIGTAGDTSPLEISDGLLANIEADSIPATWNSDEVTVEAVEEAGVQVTVNAPETVSGTFDAIVEITDVTDLDAGQFDLSFNPNVVNVTGVESGTIGTTEIRLDQWSFVGPDTIRVLINLPGASGVSGTGSLVTINFAVTGTAGDTSPLEISDGLLASIEADSIPATWNSDQVSV